MRSRPETGGLLFTLIELLIVIAIIAILASILLPVLKKAKEQVNKIYCMNNEKQCGQVIFMYLGDMNGFYPQAYPTKWNQTVCQLGYLQDSNFYALRNRSNNQYKVATPPSAFICTTDINLHRGDPTLATPLPDKCLYYGGYYGSYGPNLELVRMYDPDFNATKLPHLHSSRVTRPELTILLGESATPVPALPINQGYLNINALGTFNYVQRWKHGSRQNILFADGHVQSISYPERGDFLIAP